MISAELIISPEGNVYLKEYPQSTVPENLEQLTLPIFKELSGEFLKSPFYGLLRLGIKDYSVPLPISFSFWQKFVKRFITHVCKLTQNVNFKTLSAIESPQENDLNEIIEHAPPLKGFEYLSRQILIRIWKGLDEALREELKNFTGSLQDYLKQFSSNWNLVGRVCFHLAEKKNDETTPFAFLATYTTQLAENATPQHLPLHRALQEYAGDKNRDALLALLLPMQKAAAISPFIENLLSSKRVFQPQLFTVQEAHNFLKAIPDMESSGLMVRVPNWWNSKNPIRPKVKVTIGEKTQGGLGLDALLDFNVQMTLHDDQELTSDEWNQLMHSQGNLIKIKEQWVEIDRDKLQTVLKHWNKLQKSSQDGVTMAEGLRLLASNGSNLLKEDEVNADAYVEWSMVKAGDWLKTILDELRNPGRSKSSDKFVNKTLQSELHATLRPYQQIGVLWLWLLYQLKLGGCLADDMGLGKTIQILSLFLLAKQQKSKLKTAIKPHLLIVPASLLGNWKSEASRFAPSLKFFVAHSSAAGKEVISEASDPRLQKYDIVITTYAYIHRLAWFKEVEWDLIILDEAQQIKNPATKQTLAVKSLKSQIRLILTGTPIENRLTDLWSLFDFTSPGLLGSNKAFSNHIKSANKDPSSPLYSRFISSLRSLTLPYILRRMKSDKTIIEDLPDKTEMQTYCSLSKEQIQLYQQSVEELAKHLKNKDLDSMKRKGMVLAYLLRFKQICNHPSQWLGYGDYNPEASGKFLRLREICEEIAAKQEKVLIFTQFREIIPQLALMLKDVFGREGLVLDGQTAIKKRSELVASFQQEQGPPFFVLSLKAGGTGLTLTRASHVIHFDRWWNPAVENQATDRAYRIGQKHPVLVHKFICSGTIEEKIDEMIAAKKGLSKELLEGCNELLLTEMTNEELLKIVSLDMQQTFQEN